MVPRISGIIVAVSDFVTISIMIGSFTINIAIGGIPLIDRRVSVNNIW